MKKILLALPLFFTQILFAQNPPTVDYKMTIDFDTENHQFQGNQKLTFFNNSDDTITEVFYHLYFNAFQPNSMMDVRQRNLPDPDKRIGERIVELNALEIGYHRNIQLKQDGVPIATQTTETILQATLNEPLPPNESTLLEMDFESQVPVQIRRSGRDNAEGIDYTMTQWYPKLAMYDERGWHPDPYVAREFYAPFGNFEVSINIDYRQKLGGTGVLQSEEAFWSKEKEEGGVTFWKLNPSKKEKRTWVFKAENVHDFAWAADEDFIHSSYDGPNDIDLHFYYLKKYRKTWEKLPPKSAEFFTKMNKKFGEYPWPQFSTIQGGDGGMEYPMATMLKGTGEFDGLLGVFAHESAHSWYYGVLGFNENQYPWLDEGFTSFAEDEILNLMADTPQVNPHLGSLGNHIFLATEKPEEFEPLSTPADYFSRNRTYGISAYSRGALFLSQLRYIIGEKAFDRGMLAFYNEWKFKHPDPWDFITIMEDESGIQLDWYLNFWMNTTKTIDYGIKEVRAEGRGNALVVLEKIGEMPMPVDVMIETKSGRRMTYQIPLVSMFGSKEEEGVQTAQQPWPWTHPEYEFSTQIPLENIAKIWIDARAETADVDRENNVWEK